MFNKISPRANGSIKPASELPASTLGPSRPAAVTAASRVLSSLSSDLRLDGQVSGTGDLQIDGQIKGEVRVGRLIVGETGAIEGNVWADSLEVRGRILGAVTARQVRLTATGYVEGDITAEQLSIDAGAYFQGRVLKTTPAAVSEA